MVVGGGGGAGGVSGEGVLRWKWSRSVYPVNQPMSLRGGDDQPIRCQPMGVATYRFFKLSWVSLWIHLYLHCTVYSTAIH